jgi:2-desacetyl-2-hydroxyethyl bacteriochlorophyllide A dehydrogenase
VTSTAPTAPQADASQTVGLMKAVRFYGGDDLRVESLPIPAPGPGDVLIRVRAAGICGSDLLGYRGLGPWQHSAADPQESGHELAGEVVALGEGTTGPAVGSRVAVEPKHLRSCGTCVQCTAGWPHLCSERGIVMGQRVASHGFSTFDTCPAANAHVIPDGISFDEAAIVDCYACAVHALNRVRPPVASHVVVIGCGAIGLAMAQVARAAGYEVTLLGTHAAALELAERSEAADRTVLISRDDVIGAEKIEYGHTASAVFEASGSATRALDRAIAWVAPAGSVCVMSAFGQLTSFDPQPALDKEVSITWSNSYSISGRQPEFEAALTMLASGRIAAMPLITHRYPLSEIKEAFEVANEKDKSHAVKVIIQP